MSERNLVQVSFRRRRSPGTSMKRHRRKSERRSAKVALVRTLRDPEGPDRTKHECVAFDPGHRKTAEPDPRFLFRLLLKHVGRSWGQVQRSIYRKIGSGCKAKKLYITLDKLSSRDAARDDGEMWSSYCYGRSIVLFVNEEGILSRKDPWRNSRRTD